MDTKLIFCENIHENYGLLSTFCGKLMGFDSFLNKSMQCAAVNMNFLFKIDPPQSSPLFVFSMRTSQGTWPFWAAWPPTITIFVDLGFSLPNAIEKEAVPDRPHEHFVLAGENHNWELALLPDCWLRPGLWWKTGRNPWNPWAEPSWTTSLTLSRRGTVLLPKSTWISSRPKVGKPRTLYPVAVLRFLMC